MAYFLFTDAIFKGEPINIFNNGDMYRDFTYVDDIVNGIISILPLIPNKNLNWDKQKLDTGSSCAPFQIFNIGNNKPVSLEKFINTIEDISGKKAIKNYLPMQDGDVYSTCANIDRLKIAANYEPKVEIKEGLTNFINWYKILRFLKKDIL